MRQGPTMTGPSHDAPNHAVAEANPALPHTSQ